MHTAIRRPTSGLPAKREQLRADAAPRKLTPQFDSPEQERIAKSVLERYRVALRNLAK